MKIMIWNTISPNKASIVEIAGAKGGTLQNHVRVKSDPILPNKISNDFGGIFQCHGYTGGKNSEELLIGANHDIVHVVGIKN